jgi:hypothetical protein
VECRWVIECKLWKGRVEKKDVLTLSAGRRVDRYPDKRALCASGPSGL